MKNQETSKSTSILGLLFGALTSFFAKKYSNQTIQIENNYINTISSLLSNRHDNNQNNTKWKGAYQKSLEKASNHLRMRNQIGVTTLTLGVCTILYNLYKLSPYPQSEKSNISKRDNDKVSLFKHKP